MNINNPRITKRTFANTNQILFAVEHQVSVGIVVDDTVATANEYGKKIVKAGTPLYGDLDDRTEAFVKASPKTTEGQTTTPTKVTGILLHDVDVTDGEANGTLLLFGFVNTNRIDSSVKTLLTSDIREALPLITMVAM